MSSKKYILSFLCLLSICILPSCSLNKKKVTSCDISGIIKGNDYVNGWVYLKDLSSHNILDSVCVKNGAFEFKNLEKDTTYAALIMLKTSIDDSFPTFLPVIIEPGELKAEMGGGYVRISGSPLNESMQDFLQGIDDFSILMHEKKYSPEESRQLFSEYLTAQIKLNKDNVVSEYIRQAYTSRLIKTNGISTAN